MAKYYTEQAPTPVFAVTFVSNRKGIVKPPQNNNTNNISNNTTANTNPEDLPNNIVDPDLKEKLQEKIDDVKFFRDTLLPKMRDLLFNQNLDDNYEYKNNEFFDAKFKFKSLKLLRQELLKFRNEDLKSFISSSNTTTTESVVEDTEYLVYSNLEIQSTGPNDLSQQSNWYLREADVELTRDWPVCKAKLIVAAKLNDDGSIPQIKQVEQGFVYNQSQQVVNGKETNNVQFSLIPGGGGRFLSADDEVRIYAGYKNDTCISMDDLDQYPFDFTNLETTGDIPAGSQEAIKIADLEAEKKAIKEALDKLNNPLTDFEQLSPIYIATVLSAMVATSALSFSAFLASTGLARASFGTLAVTPIYGTVIGLGTAAVIAEKDAANERRGITKKIERDYLEGRISFTNFEGGRFNFDNNKALKDRLNNELASINNLIQVIQKKAGVETKKYCADKNKIAPIFWGFIDSVDFISNSDAGVQIIYNLRDRSRILADTKLVTLPYLNKDNNERGAFEGLRHKTIEGVYRATNGGVYLDNNYISATTTQWREGFEVGEVITLYDNKIDDKTGNRIADQVGKVTDIRSALAEQRIKFSAAIEDQARWTIANSFLSSKDIKQGAISNYDPLFHIWTLQPPVVQGGGQSVMQIVNKSPFEILTYLQVTEVMPIDFFSSHVNGHFLFAPRVLDTTGLNDPERGNRLYFFFQCFDKVPEARSLIKDIRVQTSTIGVYNRFAIANAEFNNPTNASLKDLYTVVDIASANTKNRKVPIKQHIIVDPKIKDQANKEGYAQGLALTTASIMARDNTTVIFKVIGDSTFYPGEAVRIYNTVLHGKDTFTFNSQSESSAQFLKKLYEKVQELQADNGAVKQGGTQNKVVNLNKAIEEIRGAAGTNSDDLNDVLPMYKVRAITHSLKAGGSDAGYTTKIVAIADIL